MTTNSFYPLLSFYLTPTPFPGKRGYIINILGITPFYLGRRGKACLPAGRGDEANRQELSSKIQNIGGIVYNDLNLFGWVAG